MGLSSFIWSSGRKLSAGTLKLNPESVGCSGWLVSLSELGSSSSSSSNAYAGGGGGRWALYRNSTLHTADAKRVYK